MRADAHDRLLAFLSHLPQLTASALMQVVGDAVGADGLALAGRGLVDTTRLASSPADIWQDIAATNADEIGAGARRAHRRAAGAPQRSRRTAIALAERLRRGGALARRAASRSSLDAADYNHGR